MVKLWKKYYKSIQEKWTKCGASRGLKDILTCDLTSTQKDLRSGRTATLTPSGLFGPVLWPDSVLKKIQAERSRKQEMRAESKRPQCIPSYPQCLAASWANTFSITADPSGNETSNPGSIGAALLSIDRQQRTSRGATQPVDAARLFVHFIPTTSATFHFFFFFHYCLLPRRPRCWDLICSTHTHTHTDTY